jgi:uncharacterized protein (TIGR02996 family)
MSQELLDAVLANPDDDSPRLAYADWFEENGEPDRAAFIRCQIELAKLPKEQNNLNNKTYLELATQEALLKQKNHDKWIEPYQGKGEPLQGRDTHALFRRGFVEVIWMRGQRFSKLANKIFKRFPCREARLMVKDHEEFFDVCQSDSLAKLHTLELSLITKQDFWAVLSLVGLSQNLRKLQRFYWPDLTTRTLEFLQNHDAWHETEIVVRRQQGMTDDDYERFRAKIPHLTIVDTP